MPSRLVGRLAALLLSVFYRRWSFLHAERIPAKGPLVVCANHHGSLVDPLVLLAGLPLRLRPLAKAPLFSIPVLSTWLRALGALPVYRPQDRHIATGSNRSSLAAAVEALRAGDSILVFPEGLSKSTPRLSPLRPGAARMALEAEAASGFELGVRLLPVGIHLEDAGSFRRGKVVALAGDPIPAALDRDLWERDRDAAVRSLLGRLETALRALVVEVESPEELRLLRLAVSAWAAERAEPLDDAAEARHALRFAEAYRAALERDPSRIRALRTRLEEWSRTLGHFRLDPADLDRRYTLWNVASWVARRAGALALAAVPGIPGAILSWPPWQATRLVASRFVEGEDSWASVKLTVAFAAYPAWWISVALATWLAAGPRLALAALLALPLLGLAALVLRDVSRDARSRVRAFLLLGGGGGLRSELARGRRAIHDAVEELRLSAGEI